ncbi:hypothetical protein AVEN_112337-1 [Araneus ventricosus]|uniref:Uncharacterized protein n=1 Tax=Araneus ventricosus TaxID=182803 RepID=A0A4Y2NJJ9_ARAVE|nr:hypothetical protein AVEN_112337-1 [Araneus ventricosus]
MDVNTCPPFFFTFIYYLTMKKGKNKEREFADSVVPRHPMREAVPISRQAAVGNVFFHLGLRQTHAQTDESISGPLRMTNIENVLSLALWDPGFYFALLPRRAIH